MVDLALYHPEHGFYERGGRAGRGGADFVTSPEVGPLFGSVLARAVHQWWEELGAPDPFAVVEVGAGAGSLAASMLDAGLPEGSRYTAVELSSALRAAAEERIAGRAEVVASIPPGPFVGVIVANELLDNLPFRLLQRTGDRGGSRGDEIRSQFGWDEVFVGPDLAEVLVPTSVEMAALADRMAPNAAPGSRIPLQAAARAWATEALGSLLRGRLVAVDYCDTTMSMAGRPWGEWVRTYRGHGRAGHPLDALGEADITCEVAVDQLVSPTEDRSQADFLRAHGMDDLVATARRDWQARAHVGDLEAVVARSRVTEAAALADPDGLGAFRVLEWEVTGRLERHG